MIPTVIAISIVIFVIINLPQGNYFTAYIAELQESGEPADLAKIHFFRNRVRLRPTPLGAILILGRRANSGRLGILLLL